MGTVAVLIVLAAIVAAIIYSMIKRKNKKGGGSCGCGCGDCAMASVCRKENK